MIVVGRIVKMAILGLEDVLDTLGTDRQSIDLSCSCIQYINALTMSDIYQALATIIYTMDFPSGGSGHFRLNASAIVPDMIQLRSLEHPDSWLVNAFVEILNVGAG